MTGKCETLQISEQNIKEIVLTGKYWGLRKRRIWK
jgi:hypothetical protein